MSDAKYLWIHDCDKPVMFTEYPAQRVYRTWYGRRKIKAIVEKAWETKTVMWECSICRSEWRWCGGLHERSSGWWSCHRRPEVWKDYNANTV